MFMLLRTAPGGLTMSPAPDATDCDEAPVTDNALAAVLAVAAALRVDADARAELKRMIADAESACPAPSSVQGAPRADGDSATALRPKRRAPPTVKSRRDQA
jgi:hypothetical protein